MRVRWRGRAHAMAPSPVGQVARLAASNVRKGKYTMHKHMLLLVWLCLASGGFGASLAQADGLLSRVQHIIIVMQENHSFDNYFGVLPYAVGTPYVPGPCDPDNHTCVDGLSCLRHRGVGAYRCRNVNRDAV